ncbi:MAG: YigZ family protein [Balneolaceae bacterium]|nr:YigZ family protein [Balneolaceae bacterium]
MKTVHSETSETYTEKGSKFIGYLHPTENLAAFGKFLDRVKSYHSDATHHCYAYRLDPINLQEFSQDDGEPSGTAGLPILNKLKSFDLINATLIVVRYYGGTNLGKSGLIAAYGLAAEMCINKADLATVVRTKNIKISYPYAQQNKIERLKSRFKLIELDAQYLADVTMTVGCSLSGADECISKLDSLEHLNINYQILGDDFVTR